MPTAAVTAALAAAANRPASATTKRVTKLVIGGKPATVTTTSSTQIGGRGARVGAAIAAMPQWVLILGGLGVLAVVWYVTRPQGKKGGRPWKSRRPFA
jgi:hypothetical protein